MTGYFAVPKVKVEIRMVFDASCSGLNAALWDLNFGLPTVESLLQGGGFDSWMRDIDIGETFPNFSLFESLHEYCGVDLRPYFQEAGDKGKTWWERWVRCMMGLKVSPYLGIKGLLFRLEWILGNTGDVLNPFLWSKVRLNLPGDPQYDPLFPWVRKTKLVNGVKTLATLLVTYVDEMHTSGA